MEQPIGVDVLICGAGAAGLTLAIELARRGVSFRLIEKMAVPFAGSRGKGIQPRTQEIFEDLGILDRIVAVGGAYPNERRYHADGSYTDGVIVAGHNASPAEPYHLPLMVPQFLTEAVLRERLLELGHRPHYDCELLGFEQDQDGVTAHLRSDTGRQTLKVRWLIGADGGRSLVRHALAVDFPGKTLGVRAVVADVMLTGLTRDAWHRFGDGDMRQQISFCPLAGTEMFQIQGPIPLDGEIDLSAAGLTSLAAARTGRDDICIHSVSWSSAYVMNARLADRYRVGRVFLVGDAAHIHPPTGGQGLNTSVQDAYNLGWKIAAVIDGAADALLDSYEQERRPVAAEMLGLANKLLVDQQRGEMRRGREVQQLDIAYPASSIALCTAHQPSMLTAGQRAPDAPLRGAGGQVTRLFHLFQGTHWTLLAYEAAHMIVPPRPGLHIHQIKQSGDLVDDQGDFHAAYRPANGTWILVRPDGYLGAIVAAEQVVLLEPYMVQVGLGLS